MSNNTKDGDGVLIPILTALLISVGVFNIIMIGGIVYTYKHPAASGSYIQIPTSNAEPVASRSPSAGQTPNTNATPEAANSPVPKESNVETPQNDIPVSVQPGKDQSASMPSQPTAKTSPTALSKSDISEPANSAPQNVQQNGDNGQIDSTEHERNWPNGKLLGTVNSDKYHSHNCQAAKKIPAGNEVWYDSIEAAEADGRKPCGICYR